MYQTLIICQREMIKYNENNNMSNNYDNAL